MRSTRTVLTAVCVACCVAMTSGGCSIVDLPPSPTTADISPERKSRAEDAIHHFEESRDFAQFQAAANNWKRGDVAGCKDTLNRLLARSPDHREGLLLMIEVRLASREPELAVPHAEHLLAVYPKDAQVQHTGGLVLDMVGREKEAVEHYRLAAELEPDNELYAVSHRTSQRAADATKASQPAVVATNGSAQVAEADVAPMPADLARAEFDAGNDSADRNGVATPDDRVRVLSPPGPDNPRVAISAAVSALRHNQPEVAQAVAEDALRHFPDSAVLHRTLGMAHFRQGDYRSSQVVLQQALSLDKSSALSYFLLGCTLAKLGQADAAEVNFRQASRIDPRYTMRR